MRRTRCRMGHPGADKDHRGKHESSIHDHTSPHTERESVFVGFIPERNHIKWRVGVCGGCGHQMVSATELIGGIAMALFKAVYLLFAALFMLVLLPGKIVTQCIRPRNEKSFISIFITGASSGLGAELAKQYARPGVTLTLTARRESKLAEVAAECERRGADVRLEAVDVRDASAMAKALLTADTVRELDLVIANAGVHPLMAGAADAASILTETTGTVTETNVLGVCNTLVPIIESMQSRRRGQLVIISSLASYCPICDPAWVAYNASKMWTRCYGMGLRGALEPFGVGVTTVCPGYVDSEMVDAVLGAGVNPQAVRGVMPVGRAVRGIVAAVAANVGVFSFPASEVIGTTFVGYNILPPFAWNALMARFRITTGKTNSKLKAL
jgi:short-subunit dehydrogenase